MEGDLLSPDESPKRAHVRRLNHVPLYVIGTLAAIVLVLLVMVGVERSKPLVGSALDHGPGADAYGRQIAGDRVGYIPAPKPSPVRLSLPVPVATPSSTPVDNSELESRRKAFYAALYAQSAIAEASPTPPPMVERAQPVEPLPQTGPTPPPDPNSLNTYNGTNNRWSLNTHLQKPPTPYILRTGWVIPALLESGMESELPGTIIAQVSQDVYDTPLGRYLLIPQGSKIIGEYANSIAYGQSRIFVAWQRIIYPNGDALDIGAMPGVDAIGETGFHDKVNNHFLRIFGSALLMSAFTAGVTLSQPNQNINSAPNAESTLSAALGQQLGQATSALLERNLSIPPTLTIRQGYSFNVVVVRDLIFNSEYHVPNY